MCATDTSDPAIDLLLLFEIEISSKFAICAYCINHWDVKPLGAYTVCMRVNKLPYYTATVTPLYRYCDTASILYYQSRHTNRYIATMINSCVIV